MNLFYIRNLMSVHTAQSIIQQFDYESNIAFLVENQSEKYKEKLISEIDNRLFNNIETTKLTGLTYGKNVRFISFLVKVLKIKKMTNPIKDYFLENEVNRVFLSNIKSYEEKLIFVTAKKLNIELNFYEEGLNLYTNFLRDSYVSYFEKSTTQTKALIKASMINLFYGKTYAYLEKPLKEFCAENAYVLFPELYPFLNYNNLVEYQLTMPISKTVYEKLSGLLDKNLYISRPYVEDGILTLHEEINLYKKVIKDFGNIVVKFHPREEQDKKDYLIKTLGINEIESTIKDIPAEKISLNVKLANLIGTFSNTLMYTSKFTSIPVHSYIKIINHSHKLVNVFEQFMLDNFDEINFIEG